MKNFELKAHYNPEDNPFDRQERIDWWQQKKLAEAKVLVVGAGAIGNETLKNLALLGIGHIFVIDFDEVSRSNLSRTVLFSKEDIGRKKAEAAAQRIKTMALNDNLKIDWMHGDIVWELGTGVYAEADIILGCLDNVETRLAVNKHAFLAKKPWIDTGINELGLRVNFYNLPQPPCYQCGISREQLLQARRRYSCDDFKKTWHSEGKVATVQIAASIVAALQVQEAVKYLCGQAVASGKQIYFQGKNNDFDIFDLTPDEDCFAHAAFPEVTDIPLGTEVSLREFLVFISAKEFSGKGAKLSFKGDRSFVRSVSCRHCGKKIDLNRPAFRIFDTETVCQSCTLGGFGTEAIHTEVPSGKVTLSEFSLEETPDFILRMSLHEAGVPYLHIVTVVDANGEQKFYKLCGDRKKIFPNWFASEA
jgi:adenylyltransferase/sulfurtransferase